MRRRTAPPAVPRACRAVAALLAAGFAWSGAALAEDGPHPIDSALEMLNLKTETGAMPDFVEQSHRDVGQDSYIPAGARPGSRDLKAKTPAEVKSLTAELDAARAAQQAGRRPKPPSASAAGAAPAKPLPPKGKARQATNR